MAGNLPSVRVYGDWDADGVVAAALIRYSQVVRKVYPLRVKDVEFSANPAGPRGIRDRLGEVISNKQCFDSLVLLDIPYTNSLGNLLAKYRELCGKTLIIYVDHHISTISAAKNLEEIVDELLVGYKPTTLLVHTLLKSLGITFTPRLEAFTIAVAGLEKAGILPSVIDKKMLDFAASISKALTVMKNPETWQRLVEWLSSPLPFGEPPISRKAIEEAVRLAEIADKKMMEAARELALSAEKLGYIRFVDVRKKWRKRGISALAGKLYKILGVPVAVLAEGEEFYLLVIRTKSRAAYKIMLKLRKMGLVEDIGGHSSLAIARVRKDISLDKLKESLRVASLQAL